MRRLIVALLLFMSWVLPGAMLHAQSNGWCGYALIEGLPLLTNQLAPFEAITPDESRTVNPSYLFQYRFSLDHSKVIIEGCWKTDLTRDLVVSLLSQSIQFNQKAMAAQVDEAIQQAVASGGQATTADVVRDYVDQNLTISYFAQGKSRDDQAAAVREYLEANAKEWEPPLDQ